MNEINQSNNKDIVADEISVKEILINLKVWYHYIFSKWKVILILALLGAIGGYYYASVQDDKYIAATTFVLEDGAESGGQLAGLGSIVGVSLGGGSDGIFKGDNLFELYKSRKMIIKTLLTKDSIDGQNEVLVNRYLKISGIRDKWREKNLPWKDITFDTDTHSRSRLQDSILSQIVKSINNNNLSVSKLDKKLSIIKVEVSSTDEVFAKEFNEEIVKNVNNFYVQTKTGKSLDNLSIIQYQVDSLKKELNNNIRSIATTIDANPNANPARQILKVPSQRGQINAESNKAMLTEMLKNLEVTKMSLRRDKPLIQVVDGPIYPLDKEHSSKLIGIIVGSFLLLFLSITFYSFVGVLKFIMRDH